jgi:peptidyl-prolyl cis-trans isomerase B (cyclophilin B)
MSSSNRRERELARAKRERQIARASAHQTKNRYTWAIAAASAFVLLIGFLVFKDSLFGAKDDPTQTSMPTASGLQCQEAPTAQDKPQTWSSLPFRENKDAYKKGNPTWTLTTNCGRIKVELFGDKAPVTVQNFEFLTNKAYFDGTPCHRLTTSGLFVLQCGDPTGLGTGGPGYTIPDENLPKSGANNYPAGTLAMANTGAPHSGGSQFFIVYKDTQLSPNYTIFGKVTQGLELVQAIADAGVSGGGVDGRPAQPVGIFSATISSPKAPAPTASASHSPGKKKPSASASATATK